MFKELMCLIKGMYWSRGTPYMNKLINTCRWLYETTL